MDTQPKTYTVKRVFVDEDTNSGILEVTAPSMQLYRVSITRGGKIAVETRSSVKFETSRRMLGGGCSALDLAGLALVAVVIWEQTPPRQVVDTSKNQDIRPWPELD